MSERLYALIGNSLKNTFSKNYFNQKFAQQNIQASYINLELQNFDGFAPLLAKHPQLAGCNVTIPFKQTVISFLDEVSDEAKQVGAVNTVKIINQKTYGYNTDIAGFEKSLLPLLKPWHIRALILGNGGAAQAVKFVLTKLGLTYTTVSRAAEGLNYHELNKADIRSHQVIINTTPLGMHPNQQMAPAIPYQFLTNKHLAYDLIYLPEETLFLTQCKNQQATIKNGLEMLHTQADESYHIWFKN